ncbi:uncharacterized protein LOC133477667 isoform X2 [Phyllopteryx taeniolatus]|uniref:uncharacterized protein LOC133477667 isoform X2 n=1 Tax=Phyllopteryx taeniolatus TaxID=161469 RepID=UPI002AD23906|nr:uncharacterized protein LOC133477667 isoform X2 [Phyllopteryx taeniolatus]XP_061628663.1 uncharacterized protein LOC133477667 isoform X2 [Phyllopteryx taeniolatus]XP_061628664.1 uncharacterized protein LOC133477667 isoform X2 [Phyllopteryx taeniolatus]XP_061628665.1 uncharacterized protein LOC133477667 isoform X2 [Phyllopteryx taeniolatus]XP_061628666.1 uncharacterized protein LOC133477667 isoform X2 [Phyllopteryx taeniolatus]XP_061628667.1 uncharacterized protein LOC133477667 isoform X2 [P
MDFHPQFRYLAFSKQLTLESSKEASKIARASRSAATVTTCKMADQVTADAKARVVQGGGDPGCWQLVLSECELQFGQYRGRTFKWLLSNDVGYACSILASHQKERDGGDTSQSPLARNKDGLASYAQLFLDMSLAVRNRMMLMGAPVVREMDDKLLEFGEYRHETYRFLYDSPGEEHRSYVAWMRKTKVFQGSRLHSFQQYILGRDRQAKYNAGEGEPSDQQLMEAAAEVESQHDV